METRISSVEVARFMAAMMVALGHFTFLANEGSSFLHFAYVAVEFFLMLSGFFMMCEVTKKQKDGKAIPSCDALFYALRKVVKIWGIYVVALTFMFVVRVMTSDGMSMQEILGELYHFKWEYLMIHMAGYNPSPAFDVDYLLPPAWYMSAMVIATVPAYFLAAKFQKTYSGLIAPLSASMIYTYIIQTQGTLDVGNSLVANIVMLGVLRAYAGISLGAFIYRYTEKVNLDKARKYLNVADFLAWIAVIGIFFLNIDNYQDGDSLFLLLPFSIILFNGSVSMGVVSRFLNSHGKKLWLYLGRLSLYVYLFHFQICYLWQAYIHIDNIIFSCVLYVLVVIVLSALVMNLHQLIKKRKLAKHEFRQ